MIDDGYGERLVAARISLGLGRREMAARLETPFSTYEQWELGRYRVPGAAVVAAEALCELKDREIQPYVPRARHSSNNPNPKQSSRRDTAKRRGSAGPSN